MDQIDELLNRGVDKIYPNKESLEKLLRSGKKIRLYQGFDPSGIQLHIGHLVGLRKLRQFQRLGHQVIFLIGDGTGQAGDPSGKTRGRDKYLTRDKLKANAEDYVRQAHKIIDFEGENAVKIRYNGDWLNKLSLVELLDIAGHFTLQQLEERDIFDKRKKEGQVINMREFLYPLLQGYDSVAMKVDLEIGGTDQTFNMLAGRKLVREMQNREKFVLTTPLLTDSSGCKIGKTEGNVIALNSSANDLFGQIMNLPDDVIVISFEYITDLGLSEVRAIKKKLVEGDNPMIHKKRLAFELVRMLNNRKEAEKASRYFESAFQKRDLMENIPEIKYNNGEISLIDLLFKFNLVSSKGKGKRLIQEGAIDIDGKTIKDINFKFRPANKTVIKIGKHKFVKVIINK